MDLVNAPKNSATDAPKIPEEGTRRMLAMITIKKDIPWA